MNQIVTRFAPSPTGYLHIGSARTALFSYLFAKANQGKFLLRIEDTDRQRSTQEAVDAILDGLKWLNIDWDEEEVYQFSCAQRHKEVALELLEKGKAYKCFLTPQELEILREQSMQTGKPIVSKWRDVEAKDHPDLPYSIRIKAPKTGVTIVNDEVQGEVITDNSVLDDMVLLRSDGTPTYMLAVVVDDHDMGVTHVIRGDDHLTNTPRQIMIYDAMGWAIPYFAHIPLIHGPDGKKLSKRHGALGVEAYEKMGYLPESICNYLLRLGWSHGDEEIISRQQAIEWFNLKAIGKSPSRLDFKKLDHINNHYLKLADNERLIELAFNEYADIDKENILKGMDSLKQRANTLNHLKEMAEIYIHNKVINLTEEDKATLKNHFALVQEFEYKLAKHEDWSKDSLMELAKLFCLEKHIKLGDLAALFRLLLTGSNVSPSIFEILSILGKETSLRRINALYNS
jgi:glutamyl-tRNA synthetase